MQSIFRLPWCSDPIAPKSERAFMNKMRASPVVEMPSLHKLKRKRATSSDVSPLRAHDNKKSRPGHYDSQVEHLQYPQPAKSLAVDTPARIPEAVSVTMPAPTSADVKPPQIPPIGPTAPTLLQPEAKSKDSSLGLTVFDMQVPASEDVKGFTPLQQVIENEFNMQILMKHDELRLIEQELAKCQVALEQLRRCELRPYPGSDRPCEAVSFGCGPAIAPPSGYTRPSHPAPYGVTDGPYSRHYKQWLLHDPEFDAIPARLLQPDTAGRPSRNGAPASRRSVGQPFTFPGRPSERAVAMPNYPAPAPSKDRNLPNVLRRSTDNLLVKLICNNCQRGNFSSIQGFLNHCRIAHKVDYKSHDAAAIDCGQPLDESEAATLPVETQQTPAPKPAATRVAPALATSTPGRTSVHPFNSTANVPRILKQPRPAKPHRQPVHSVKPAPTAAPAQFAPSAQLPRLSAHLAKHHFGGDLAKLAADAKQKVDLGFEYFDLPSPNVSEQNTPSATPVGARTFPQGGRSGSFGVNSAHIPRPESRKGVRQLMPQSKARPSPLMPLVSSSTLVKSEHEDSPDSLRSPDTSMDLSPHTADSNPGLVSDHEDDDHGSASESEEVPAPHSPASRPITIPGNRPSCADNMEIDVAVEDDEIDHDGLIIRRNSLSGDGRKFGAPGK